MYLYVHWLFPPYFVHTIQIRACIEQKRNKKKERKEEGKFKIQILNKKKKKSRKFRLNNQLPDVIYIQKKTANKYKHKSKN